MTEEELEFKDWVDKLMKDENLGVREFARRIGISHPTVLDILSGITPSLKTCKAIAEYTRTPLSVVLQRAGIMNGPKMTDEKRQELIHLYDMMNEGNQDDQIAYARMKLQMQEREDENKKNGKGNRPSKDL